MEFIKEWIFCQRCRRKKGNQYVQGFDSCPMTGNTDGQCPAQRMQIIGLASRRKEEGNEFFRSGLYEEAIEKYTKALQILPNEALYHSNRSKAYLKIENFDAAREDSDIALRLDSKNVKIWWGHINIMYQQGKKDDAIDAFKQAWIKLDRRDSNNNVLVKLENDILTNKPPKEEKPKNELRQRKKNNDSGFIGSNLLKGIGGNDDRINSNPTIPDEEKPERIRKWEAYQKEQEEKSKRLKKKLTLEEEVARRCEMKKKALDLLQKNAPEKGSHQIADEKLKEWEAADAADKLLEEQKNTTHEKSKNIMNTSNTIIQEQNNENTIQKGDTEVSKEKIIQPNPSKTSTIADDDIGTSDEIVTKKKPQAKLKGYDSYSKNQKDDLVLVDGHQYMSRPTDIILPEDFRKPIGNLSAEEFFEKHNAHSERKMLCVFGDLFDVSDRPDKYGPTGPYRELTGKDITYGLLIGNDRPEFANKFYDIYKSYDEEGAVMGLVAWSYHYTREYGDPVGRLTEYDNEGFALPTPPKVEKKDQQECSIQ